MRKNTRNRGRRNNKHNNDINYSKANKILLFTILILAIILAIVVIFYYLKNNNWIRREHLTLGEMVDDIINVSDKDLIDYKIKNNNRMDW